MLHCLTLSLKRLSIPLLACCIVSTFLATPSWAVPQERPAAPAETVIDSDITTDATWTFANSPYHITNNIDVEAGVTLTIEPGVQVLVDPKIYIHVRDGASLIAKGTPSQHIVFNRYAGARWRKIWFHDGASSYLRYVEVLYAGSDSNDENASLHYQGTGTHVFNMSEVRTGDQFGVVVEDSVNLTIAGALLTNNGKVDLLVGQSANVVVTGSTLDKRDRGQGRTVWLRSSTASLSVTSSNIWTVASDYGIQNDAASTYCIDAQNNWWGAADGPHDESGAGDACSLGSHEGSGSWVTNGVDYRNWLTAETDRAGIITPPTATFTIAPDPAVPQLPTTEYTFDASGSTDAEDYTSSLEVCWDWDNDGTCETGYSTTKTTTHVFGSGGVQTVCLVVRDTDGDTGEATQDVHTGNPPDPAFTFTQTTTIWDQVVFDASASSDVETEVSQLQAGWDWEGDGDWNVTGVGVTEIQTHTYSHLGRYWPTLYVEDTDNLTDTLRKPVDIIPPAKAVSITNSGGTLDSVDHTVQVAVYTDTIAGDVISNGLVITHTPWLTLPHSGLESAFTYQGFNLSAQSLAGQSIDEISGTYTITISYDYDYFVDVLRLPPFEGQLRLYRWVDVCWTPVTSTLKTAGDQLVTSTGFFGDFVLAMDVYSAYLPLVIRTD